MENDIDNSHHVGNIEQMIGIDIRILVNEDFDRITENHIDDGHHVRDIHPAIIIGITQENLTG